MIMYHGSPKTDLTIIQPFHNKLFLSSNKHIAILFIAKFDDFQLSIDVDDKGIPIITEHIKDAKEYLYNHKSGAIYQVEVNKSDMFLTAWRGEAYTNCSLRVHEAEYIHDGLQYLDELIEEKKIKYISFDSIDKSAHERYLLKKALQYYTTYGHESLLSLRKYHPQIYKSVHYLIKYIK